MALQVLIYGENRMAALGLAKLLEDAAADLRVEGVVTEVCELRSLLEARPSDAVILDVAALCATYVDAIREVRRCPADTCAIVLSRDLSVADVYETLLAGAVAYVSNDIELRDLVSVIRLACGGLLVVPLSSLEELMAGLEGNDRSLVLNGDERAMLAAIGEGLTNREIAGRFFLSERTVRRRTQSLYRKLHLADRLQAAIYAVQRGLT